MKAGDIVFVRGNSLLSLLVKYFDKGEFSHVALAVSETHIFEAQYFTKTRIAPIYFDDYEVVDLGLTNEEREKAKELAQKYTGKFYDYFQILSILIRSILKKNNLKLWNSPNNYICSEVIGKILLDLGKIDEKDKDMIAEITPNQLYKYLLNLKSKN